MTSSRCSGTGSSVAMMTTAISDSLTLEEFAEGGGHVPVAAALPQSAAAEPGEVAGQLRVLLAGRVEQDVQPGQPRRERPRVRAGVVYAVRQQQDPRVPGRDPGPLAP